MEDIGIFGIGQSRAAEDIRLYDSQALEEIDQDERKEFTEMNSNLGTCLKSKSIKNIKRLAGGRGNRRLCEINDDNNGVRICSYQFMNPHSRSDLLFEELVTLDKDYILACPSLINNNKLLV